MGGLFIDWHWAGGLVKDWQIVIGLADWYWMLNWYWIDIRVKYSQIQ